MASKREVLGHYFTLQRGTTYESRLLGRPGPVLLGLATIHRNGGFRNDKLETYGGESPAKLLVNPGELYVSLKDVTQAADLLGAVARLPIDSKPGRLTQDTVKLEPRDSAVPLDYLYWLMRTPQYRLYCRAHSTGTTNLGLAREDFLAFPAPEPSRAQQMMVETLNDLEKKIELNRRMNETLEAMARALFKSWFVDFDPVRAKMAGRDPGLPKDIADLFPDRLVESELGEIPEGWRAGRLGSEAERCGGRIQTGPFGSQLHASDYVADGVPVVMPKDLAGRRIVTSTIARVRPQDADRLARHRLQPGDIVYSRRGDVEQHGLIRSREAGWLCGTGCLLVRLGPGWLSSMFTSMSLNQPVTRTWIVQHAIGATMPNLNTGILSRVPFLVPTDDLLRKYNEIADPLDAQMVQHNAINESLVSVRDLLLPMLVSGELRL